MSYRLLRLPYLSPSVRPSHDPGSRRETVTETHWRDLLFQCVNEYVPTLLNSRIIYGFVILRYHDEREKGSLSFSYLFITTYTIVDSSSRCTEFPLVVTRITCEVNLRFNSTREESLENLHFIFCVFFFELFLKGRKQSGVSLRTGNTFIRT